MRAALWEQLSDLPMPSQVTEWVLTPAEIMNAAQVAPAGAEVNAKLALVLMVEAAGEEVIVVSGGGGVPPTGVAMSVWISAAESARL